jgi:hypothetical protein
MGSPERRGLPQVANLCYVAECVPQVANLCYVAECVPQVENLCYEAECVPQVKNLCYGTKGLEKQAARTFRPGPPRFPVVSITPAAAGRAGRSPSRDHSQQGTSRTTVLGTQRVTV